MRKGPGYGERSVCSNLTHRHPWDQRPFTWAVEPGQSATPLVEETAAWHIHAHTSCVHTHAHANTHVGTMHSQVHIYTHTHPFTPTHIILTRTHIHSHIYSNIFTHIFIHTYAFTRKYVSSHTDFCTLLETRKC